MVSLQELKALQASFWPTDPEVNDILTRHYGFTDIEFKSLNSITGKSMRIAANMPGGNKHKGRKDTFVCKCLDPDSTRLLGLIEVGGAGLQAAAQRHLLETGLCCSRPVATLEGLDYCDSIKTRLHRHKKVLQVLEWQEGTMVNELPLTDSIMYDLGAMAGAVSQALQTFSHPASEKFGPDEIWNNDNGNICVEKLDLVTNPQGKRLIKEVIPLWRKRFLEATRTMKKGWIYADMSTRQLVALTISTGNSKKQTQSDKPSTDPTNKYGIIDFGRLRYSLPCLELAFTMASSLPYWHKANPDKANVMLEGAAFAYAGFLSRHLTLSTQEKELCYFGIIYYLLLNAIVGYMCGPTEFSEYMDIPDCVDALIETAHRVWASGCTTTWAALEKKTKGTNSPS